MSPEESARVMRACDRLGESVTQIARDEFDTEEVGDLQRELLRMFTVNAFQAQLLETLRNNRLIRGE